MTALAVRNGASAPARPAAAGTPGLQFFTMGDIWELAERVAESRLFPGVMTAPQAFTLMMLCHADGMHPMQALRRYHIIEGRPSMRADAMQAEFQANGGRIKVLKSDATEARAMFSHPEYQPEPIERSVTYAQFEKSGLVKGKDGVKKNWRESPEDMLWARLVTKSIRKIDPGIVVGIYSEDEVEDIVSAQARLIPELPPARSPAVETARAEAFGPALPGQPDGIDDRPYHQVVTDAAKTGNAVLAGAVREALGDVDPKSVVRLISLSELHGHLLNRAIQLGHDTGDVPQKTTERIQRLTRVYKEHRGWLRGELLAYVETVEADAQRDIAEAVDARSTVADDPSVEPIAEAEKRSREPGEDG